MRVFENCTTAYTERPLEELMRSSKLLDLAVALALIGALPQEARPQSPRVATVNVLAEADRVRIVAVGDVSEMRIDVKDEAGDVVFQSGVITTEQLDWSMRDAVGDRVPPGSYLLTVSFRTAVGKLRKRVEQVTVAESEKAETQRPEPGPASAGTTITGTGTAGKIARWVTSTTLGNSVMTQQSGNVGIGITVPTSKLDIAAQDALKITGFQPFLTFRDSNAGAARSVIQSVGGGMNLFAESYLSGLNPSAYLRLDTGGNVGIGTATPQAKLDVRGNMKLGSNGQYFAPGAEENLRIVRGIVSRTANIIAGSGFSVSGVVAGDSAGEYTITFNTPFAGTPSITLAGATEGFSVTDLFVRSVSSGQAVIWVFGTDGGIGGRFHFIAIGPR
jgi:hypothetical protein